MNINNILQKLKKTKDNLNHEIVDLFKNQLSEADTYHILSACDTETDMAMI